MVERSELWRCGAREEVRVWREGRGSRAGEMWSKGGGEVWREGRGSRAGEM